jgi:hypothetical protein
LSFKTYDKIPQVCKHRNKAVFLTIPLEVLRLPKQDGAPDTSRLSVDILICDFPDSNSASSPQHKNAANEVPSHSFENPSTVMDLLSFYQNQTRFQDVSHGTLHLVSRVWALNY